MTEERKREKSMKEGGGGGKKSVGLVKNTSSNFVTGVRVGGRLLLKKEDSEEHQIGEKGEN